jgi:hypothetical protein
MDRLRDHVCDADPTLARAAALVAAIPGIEPSDARKERVARALSRDQRRRLPAHILRPGFVMAFLLVAGTVAAATVGRPFVRRAYERVLGATSFHSSPGKMQRPREPRPSLRPAPMPVVEEAPLSNSAPPAAAVSPPARAPASVTKAKKPSARVTATTDPSEAPQAETAPTPAKAPSAQESALVMSAVHALRRERDAVRAGVLLDDYLRRFPDGALAEEALALAIEAASTRGDRRAIDLAHRYLQRFPHGRFERAARAAAE